MHRLLPFLFGLNNFDSIPAKAECKRVGGERVQQDLDPKVLYLHMCSEVTEWPASISRHTRPLPEPGNFRD